MIWEKDGLRVTMFDVDHAPVVPAVGYKLEYNGKSVVVSGDTKKTAATVEMSRGADLLVHEAVDRATIDGALPMMERAQPRRAAMTRDMMSHHTTTLELAEIARDAGVKKLAITHLVPSIPPTDAAEANFVARHGRDLFGTDRGGSGWDGDPDRVAGGGQTALPYSYRSASIGSRLAALPAG